MLWRDAESAMPCAVRDRCPHRGAKRRCRVVTGPGDVPATAELECAYHGWRFDGAGRCTQHAGGARARALGRATALSARCVSCRAHGCCGWVDGSAMHRPAPPTTLARCPQSCLLAQVICGPYDVATSAPRVVENFLDTSHFGFVHEGWLGDRAHTAVPDHTVSCSARATGIDGQRLSAPGSRSASAQRARRRLGRLPLRGAGALQRGAAPSPRSPMPAQARRPRGRLCAVRSARWSPRIQPRLVRACSPSDDASRQRGSCSAFQHTIFTQDQPVLESQRPRRLLPVSARRRACTAPPTAARARPTGAGPAEQRASPSESADEPTHHRDFRRHPARAPARAAAGHAQGRAAHPHRGLARARADLRARAAQRRERCPMPASRPCARPTPSPTCRASSTSTTPAPACC